ncbi:hypothetical protein AGRA3207_007397 [Actinomadura graeca]|uniref:TniQ protein n=1 Tax=Actinomadura graeca TaxID=2750812 RepID=A0ABX8R442_9ACTN|nr:hypothetical protein [Actinomadura graeca]QXJ25836.1 hypothetical protein AGRA3207_007397 [Actinomadura graeca]
MTVGGWVPWLADTLDPDHGQQAFHTYVCQDSVLLPRRAAGRNIVARWLPWIPPGTRKRSARKICPSCAADPDRGTPLTATLLLTTSCPEHGCRLEPEVDVRVGIAIAEPVPARHAPTPLVTLDRLAHQGLTSGGVTLPGRAIHVGLWFRLLRTLVDEVTVAPSQVGARSAATLHQIWDTAAVSARAGLRLWRPYERLDPTYQEAILRAAGTALHLAETGAITARGTLGALLDPPRHQPVHDGDPPGTPADPWRNLQGEAEEVLERARTDPATARQILTLFTRRCRTLARFDRERHLLIASGVPAAFLPDAREFGRSDLLQP